ncbi:hypothetical protein, partial [Paenibacillus jiagnxiensis]|uniref:hypothetical protein n=1 Tax=Paenibacillus jiagnxiensis TaxID=3228926 RepID=UPI00339F4E0B
ERAKSSYSTAEHLFFGISPKLGGLTESRRNNGTEEVTGRHNRVEEVGLAKPSSPAEWGRSSSIQRNDRHLGEHRKCLQLRFYFFF